MYRINLHREYRERRQVERRRSVRAALAVALIGVELALVAWLGVSGTLLGERTRTLNAEIVRLAEDLRALSTPRPELEVARALADIRKARLDWSPKLSAIACRITPALRLIEMSGRPAGRGQIAVLDLTGVVRGTGAPMEPVAAFIDAIKADSTIVFELPHVRLGTLEGSESGLFKIVCEGRGVGE